MGIKLEGLVYLRATEVEVSALEYQKNLFWEKTTL